MKVVKTYTLSEKSLGKDIEKFMSDAKRGTYQYDYKHGQEGLKILKAYFRMIEDEFKIQNYQTTRECYKRLLFFLLQREYDYFNYEDIMSKFNAEKIVGNYFACLIRLCSVAELYAEFLEYLKIKEDYFFESAEKAVLDMPEDKLSAFLSLAKKDAEKITEKEYALHDLIYFLLTYAKKTKNKKEYFSLCEKYSEIVGEEQKGEYKQ
jgi:hypothetical protein